MDSALAGVEIHVGEEIEESDKSVAFDESRHETIRLGPKRDLQAVDRSRTLAKFIQIVRKLELKNRNCKNWEIEKKNRRKYWS